MKKKKKEEEEEEEEEEVLPTTVDCICCHGHGRGVAEDAGTQSTSTISFNADSTRPAARASLP